MSRSLTLVAALTLSWLAHSDAARAESVFVYAEVEQIGVVTSWHNPLPELGEVSLADHGVVEHLSWSVTAPRDAASGLPTGKRAHRPVLVGVRMSAATLHLGTALSGNLSLPVVKLLFFSEDPLTGVQALRRTMTLTNASVSALSVYTIRADDGVVTYADVSFVYAHVGIEDHDALVSYEDASEAPVSGPQIP